jgi:hypothetical protein
MPIPVAAQSEKFVWDSSLAEIVGYNLAEGMDVCPL